MLLTAGKAERGFVEAILHLVPKGGSAKAFFDGLRDLRLVADTAHAQTEGDIFKDAAGKWIRFLEDHADIAAELHHIDRGIVNFDILDDDFACGDPRADDFIVHAVDATQQGRLAATGGADESGDRVAVEIKRDIFERLGRTVAEAEILNLHGAFAAGLRHAVGGFLQGFLHGIVGRVHPKLPVM